MTREDPRLEALARRAELLDARAAELSLKTERVFEEHGYPQRSRYTNRAAYRRAVAKWRRGRGS